MATWLFIHHYISAFKVHFYQNTVKHVLVAISIKQATCIKRPVFWFPIKTNKYKCTCIEQAPALSKHFSVIPSVLAQRRLDCMYFLDVKMTYWCSSFWDAYIFYAHNMSINKITFWEQVCIIWFFFMLTLYVYLKKKATFKCNIGGCHVKTISHRLLIGWSSAAVSEQVRTPFGLLVRKPRRACRWWGGSLGRTSSSVPPNCLP